MAKLFKTSVFLLLAAFLLIAEANHHKHDDHDDHDHDHDHDHEHHDHHDDHNDHDNDDNNYGAADGGAQVVQVNNIGDGGNDGGNGAGGCQCNDAKLRDFFSKFLVLYRSYASKELAPELKALLGKLVDFTLNYLAKEKPDQVNRVNSFLQTSARVTGGAVATASAGVVS